MQRYFCKSKNDDSFVLEDSDIHHIINVMRMHDDDKIEVVFEKNIFV